jgi:hypothetical protein
MGVMTDEASPGLAEQLGIRRGMAIRELGANGGFDPSIRADILSQSGRDFLVGDSGSLANVVIIWWPQPSENLRGILTEASRSIRDDGIIWLFTLKTNDPELISERVIQASSFVRLTGEADPVEPRSLMSHPVTEDWNAIRLLPIEFSIPAPRGSSRGDRRLSAESIMPSSSDTEWSERGGGFELAAIYLSDGRDHEAIERALEQVLNVAEIQIVDRFLPRLGSWSRTVRLRLPWGSDAPVVDQIRSIRAEDSSAKVISETSVYLTGLTPLIVALQASRDAEAVIHAGALLIVKVNESIVVHQLTSDQRRHLSQNPSLSERPREILEALSIHCSPAEPESVGDDSATPTHSVVVDL